MSDAFKRSFDCDSRNNAFEIFVSFYEGPLLNFALVPDPHSSDLHVKKEDEKKEKKKSDKYVSRLNAFRSGVKSSSM